MLTVIEVGYLKSYFRQSKLSEGGWPRTFFPKPARLVLEHPQNAYIDYQNKYIDEKFQYLTSNPRASLLLTLNLHTFRYLAPELWIVCLFLSFLFLVFFFLHTTWNDHNAFSLILLYATIWSHGLGLGPTPLPPCWGHGLGAPCDPPPPSVERSN